MWTERGQMPERNLLTRLFNDAIFIEMKKSILVTLIIIMFAPNIVISKEYSFYKNLSAIDLKVIDGNIVNEAFLSALSDRAYSRTTLAKRGMYNAYLDHDLHHDKFPYLFSKIQQDLKPLVTLRCKGKVLQDSLKYVDFIIYGKDSESKRTYEYLRIVSLDKKYKNGVVYPLMANKKLPSDTGTSRITFGDSLSYIEYAIYMRRLVSNSKRWGYMQETIIGQLNKYYVAIDAAKLTVDWKSLQMLKNGKDSIPMIGSYVDFSYKKCSIVKNSKAHDDLIIFESFLSEQTKVKDGPKKGKF